MAWAAPIAGAIVGGLMSDGGGGGGSNNTTSTTVQKADPWSGVQPALTQLYGSALQNFQGGGPNYYPGQTVAPKSDATNLSQQAVWNIATQGSPLIGNAQEQANNTMAGNYFINPATQGMYDFGKMNFMDSGNPGLGGLESTARGDFLMANPYVDDMFGMAAKDVGDQFSKNVLPGVASMFSGSGRYGSDAMASGVGQATNNYGNTLEDLATKIYGGNFMNERNLMQGAQGTLTQAGLAGRGLQQQAVSGLGDMIGRERTNQMNAMVQSPTLRAADYMDAGQLANMGASQDLYNQGLINADMERYNFGQNRPNASLNFLSSILNGAPMGSTSTTSGSTGGGGLSSILTGAMGGYNMGSSLLKGFGNGNQPSLYSGGGGFGTGSDYGNQDYGMFF